MARLKRVSRDELTIRRRRHGRSFGYIDQDGEPVRDAEIRERARGLGIPPAWTEVRIAANPRAHIQACGTDAAGRLCPASFANRLPVWRRAET